MAYSVTLSDQPYMMWIMCISIVICVGVAPKLVPSDCPIVNASTSDTAVRPTLLSSMYMFMYLYSSIQVPGLWT